jgi:hypothetical protein
MDFMEQIKTMTREQIARVMVELLTYVSPDTFVKLVILASRLTESKTVNASINAVKENLVEEGEEGQAARMFKRVMTELSPHCLKTVARNLFINGLLRSANIREEFTKKHGFEPPFTILMSPTMQCNLT